MSIDLDGRAAIVTGAAGGIGRAASLALAEAGARVMAVDLDADGAAETARLVEQAGGEARSTRADVSSSEDVAAYVDAATGAFGGVDILFNNAGWQGAVAPVVDHPLDAFDKVMAINVRGVFLGMQHALPHMLARGSGAIVNTASLGARIGVRSLAPYVASKHAVLGLTRSAALEVARKGVRVNAVCPGQVDTELLRSIEAGEAGDDAGELRRKRTAGIPMGRYAEPREIADVMVWLASDMASHVTGQAIDVNGGSHAG